MAAWIFELTGLQGSPPYYPLVGEITDAFDKTVTLELNRFDTCSFRIRSDHPFATQIAMCEGYVKAYRDGILTFFGPIVSTEETGSVNGSSIAVNCISSGWILTKRFIRKWTFTQTEINRGTLAVEMLNWLNRLETGGATGDSISPTASEISPGTITGAGTVTGFHQVVERFWWDVFLEVATGGGGFDWRVMPLEPPATAPARSGTLIGSPVIGVTRSNTTFEWGVGTRNNALSFKRTFDRETQANHILVYNNENPVNPEVADIDDTSSFKWGRMQAVVDTELTDVNLMLDLATAHLEARTNPRMRIEMQPHLQDGTGRVPEFRTDYDIGDTVRARVVHAESTTAGFDQMIRVWSVSFAIDDNSTERITLGLVDQ